MFKNKYIIVGFIIIAAISNLAFGRVSTARSNETQNSLNGDLTSFDAAEVSAYRWNAMAKFYEAQNSLNGDLTSFDAAEVSAYRWSAMARFYETQSSLNGDLTSFDAVDTSDYRLILIESGFWTRQAPLVTLKEAVISK